MLAEFNNLHWLFPTNKNWTCSTNRFGHKNALNILKSDLQINEHILTLNWHIRRYQRISLKYESVSFRNQCAIHAVVQQIGVILNETLTNKSCMENTKSICKAILYKLHCVQRTSLQC